MSEQEQKHDQLLSLMQEALDTCTLLRVFSEENFQVYLDDDDDKIIEIINERDKIIDSLIHLEYKIDLMLEEMDEYEYGEALPCDIEELRQSSRSALDSVSQKDMEAMQLVSGKMQKYKDKTLKARSMKKISAYKRAAFCLPLGNNIDYKK
jgi:hypothetical protein